MKKIFLMAAAVAVVMFTSCSKENDEGSTGDTPVGKEATMSLKLTFPRTYADANETASEKESKINKVDVFVFDATTGALVTHRPLTSASFTATGNTYSSTVDIITTSGTRKIGVGINLPAAMVTAITSTQKNITAVNANTVYDVTSALIATDNNFVMFSTEMPVTTLVADADATATDNKITMDIERMAGKGALAKTATFEYSPNVTALGSFGPLDYKLMQTNLKSYLMAEGRSVSERRDPNYLSSDYVENSPTGNQYDGSVFENTAVYKPLEGNGDYASHNLRPAFYGAENVSDFYQKGTTTYFVVKGLFTPTKFSDATGAQTTPSYTTGDDFWVVSDGATTHICADAATATTLSGVVGIFPGGSTIVKHVGGYCYWAVFVGKMNERGFLRNNYYVGQVKAISGFGSGTEGDVIVPPTDPVDGSKSTIDVEFTVLDWTFNLGDEVTLD